MVYNGTAFKRPRAIDLFSGAGGLALGIQEAGFDLAALVERDSVAVATLRLNATVNHQLRVPSSRILHHDVLTEPSLDQLAEWAGDLDLLAGGPPCQPFSLGGLGRGADDDRNLWPWVMSAVSRLHPRAIFFENVVNLSGPRFRPYLEYLKLQLSFPSFQVCGNESWPEHLACLKHRQVLRQRDLGVSTGGAIEQPEYDIGMRVLNAADHGVPQLRRRLFIVGFRRDLRIPLADDESPPHDSAPLISSDALSRWPTATHSQDALLWELWISGAYRDEHDLGHSDPPSHLAARLDRLQRDARVNGPPITRRQRWRTLRETIKDLPPPPWPDAATRRTPDLHFRVDGARIYAGHSGNDPDWPAKAIKAGAHGNPGGEHIIVWQRQPLLLRYLSPRECARIQGFPDGYDFSGLRTSCIRQIGNAVPVPLARIVAERIRDLLSAVAKPTPPAPPGKMMGKVCAVATSH